MSVSWIVRNRTRYRELAGVMYGLTAGLAFSILAWGLDGYYLSKMHGAYPWLKLWFGLIVCLVVGGFMGWITTKISHPGYIIITWTFLAIIYSRLVFWIPLRLMPFLVGFRNKAMAEMLQYTETDPLNVRVWVGFSVVLVVAIVTGLIENKLIEDYVYTKKMKTLWMPLVICFTFFSLIGGNSDTLVNRKLREPIQVLDGVLQFSLENREREFAFDPSRSKQLDAVKEIKIFLTQDRDLIPIFFNDSLEQVVILINFNRRWMKCTLMYNRVSECKPAIYTPWIIDS